jgi:hypothetical protein
MNTTKTQPFPKKLNKEYKWLSGTYPDLSKKYPNMWIAFFNEKIISSGKSLVKVLKEAHKKLPTEPEIPHTFIEKGIHIYENSIRN